MLNKSSDIGDSSLSMMTEKETIEMFVYGLSRAASKARELGKVQENQIWLDIAMILDEMRMTGFELANARAMSRLDVLANIARREQQVTEQSTIAPQQRKLIH